MKTKKPIKKKTAKYKRVNKKDFEGIEPIKAPNYEPDIERLHNLVRAELAVVKAEEEKKAESDKQATILLVVKSNNFIGGKGESIEIIDEGFYERRYCNDYVDNLEQKIENIKSKYTKLLIRSIISSLGLGATAMFLILNT